MRTEEDAAMSVGLADDGEDLSELLSGIDWENVKMTELEQRWKAELSMIEQENVQSLINSFGEKEKGGNSLLLPHVKKAVLEVEGVETILADYCNRLELMGREIRQIEELNKSLNIQTINQEKLILELDCLLEKLYLSDENILLLEQAPFGDFDKTEELVRVGEELFRKISCKIEGDGVGRMVAVRERMEFFVGVQRRFVDKAVSFFHSAFNFQREKIMGSGAGGGGRSSQTNNKKMTLNGIDYLKPLMEHFIELIQLIRSIDQRKHLDIVAGYQSTLNAILRKELADLIEWGRSNKLPKRSDKSFLFSSLNNSASVSFSGRASGAGHQKSSSVSSVTVSTRDWASIPLFQPELIPDIQSSNEQQHLLTPSQFLHYLLLTVSVVMAQQHDLCARVLFGVCGSDSSDNDVEEGRTVKLIDSLLMASFAPVDELICAFADLLTQSDTSVSIEMLVALDIRIPQLKHDLPSLAHSLQNLKRRLQVQGERFIDEQVSVIESMKFSCRKRSGVFPFVSLFPTFLTKMEQIISTATSQTCSVRDLIHRGYERIIASIFASLDSLRVEAEQSADEKDRVNAAVMNIQNGNYLVEQLASLEASAAKGPLELAQRRYNDNLTLYAISSLHRVIPRLLDFFTSLRTLLTTIPTSEVLFHPSHNKASARRIILAHPLKELRKAIELTQGRVVKHFGDMGSGDLRVRIWRWMQEWMEREDGEWREMLEKVYGNEITLLYTSADLLSLFSEYRL